MTCKKCNITVKSGAHRCPLCGGALQGAPSQQSSFPYIAPRKKPRKLLLNLVIFLTVASAVICVVINMSTTPGNWWSLFVLGGLGSFWVSLGIAIYKRRNIFKFIIWQVVIIIMLAIAWDMATGFHRWSLNFVMPILDASTLIALTIIARAKKREVRDFVMYLVTGIILSLISLVFLLTGMVTIALPTFICLGVCLLFLSALLIFEGRTLLSELRRRMHL